MSNIFLKCISAAVFSFTFMILSGCGSGGGSDTLGQRYQGVFRTAIERPVIGSLVTIAATGDSDSTDATGSFLIDTEAQSGDVQILVEVDGKSLSVIVPEVPAGATIVTVQLELDSDRSAISPHDIKFEIHDPNDGSGGTSTTTSTTSTSTTTILSSTTSSSTTSTSTSSSTTM